MKLFAPKYFFVYFYSVSCTVDVYFPGFPHYKPFPNTTKNMPVPQRVWTGGFWIETWALQEGRYLGRSSLCPAPEIGWQHLASWKSHLTLEICSWHPESCTMMTAWLKPSPAYTQGLLLPKSWDVSLSLKGCLVRPKAQHPAFPWENCQVRWTASQQPAKRRPGLKILPGADFPGHI